jgi:hypothetical protein
MNTQNVTNAKVTGKERINYDSSSYYLIFTDKGEFTIKDELFRWNFSSSSWYGDINIGDCYKFKVGGFRAGFFNMYPNIHTKPIQKKCKTP